jgi:thiol-disulfide isomerase/thioredoxin
LIGFVCACFSDYPTQAVDRATSLGGALPPLLDVWTLLIALALPGLGAVRAVRPFGRASPQLTQRFLFRVASSPEGRVRTRARLTRLRRKDDNENDITAAAEGPEGRPVPSPKRRDRQARSSWLRRPAGKKPRAPRFELAVLWSHDQTWPARQRRALADRRLDLGELRGRRVVMNFWASWCIPCRDEAPLLNASARAHRGNVLFLGVTVQDLSEDALRLLREFKAPYVSVRDRNNKTFGDYGLTGVPETYYLDARGRIVGHVPGPVSRQTLEQGIDQLLRRAP